MSRSIHSTLEDRLKTLKRRRDFLDMRIRDYVGKDDSRDKAEASALHWAIGVIEANRDYAYDAISNEKLLIPTQNIPSEREDAIE